MADDLGISDTSPYGNTFIETPNLERLASTGMRFINAYAANPLCSPTRSSILTGLYPARTGFTSAAGHLPNEILETQLVPEKAREFHKCIQSNSVTRLDTQYQTLGKILGEKGYKTGYIGKWHMGDDPFNASQHGFQEVIGAGPPPGPATSFFNPVFGKDCPGYEPGMHIDDYVTDQSLDFIRQHKGDDFFLYLNLYDVHHPFEGKDDLIEKYRRKIKEYPESPWHPVYAAMTEEVDICIGRLLDELEAQNLREETLFVFFSDNGANLYDKIDGNYATTNEPWRGGKANIYEGGTREPLIFSNPGRVPEGVSTEALFSSVDFFPTLLDYVGVEHGENVDGQGQSKVLTGEDVSVRGEIFNYFPHFTPATGNVPAVSIRKGEWKLIKFFHDNPFQDHRFELYNLDEDPGEKENLIHQFPDIVEELKCWMDEKLEECSATLPIKHEGYQVDHENAIGGLANSTSLNSLGESGGCLELDATSHGAFLEILDLPECRGEHVLRLSFQTKGANRCELSWYEEAKALPHVLNQFYPSCDGFQNLEFHLEFTKDLKGMRLDLSTLPGRFKIRSLELLDRNNRVIKTWV